MKMSRRPIQRPPSRPPSRNTDKNTSNEKTGDWYTSKNFSRGDMSAVKQMIMKRTAKKDSQSKKKKEKKKISLYA